MRTPKWLSYTLLVSVMTTATLVAATPAQAAGKDRDTAGINKAAGTITTHSGQILTGVTFVDREDVPALRQQQAKAAADGRAGVASTLYCLGEWHYITGTAVNTYWTRLGTSSLNIWARGNRAADYWNMQFLPCWVDFWAHHAWVFLSNAFGKFVSYKHGSFGGLIPTDAPHSQLMVEGMIFVCDRDGYWKYLETNGFAARHPNDGLLFSAQLPLTSYFLFRLEPVIPGGIDVPCVTV